MKDQTGDQLEGQCTSHHQLWRTALLQGSEPPSQIIEKTGHRLQNRATISHLQYVDVLELFAKSKSDIDSLIHQDPEQRHRKVIR